MGSIITNKMILISLFYGFVFTTILLGIVKMVLPAYKKQVMEMLKTSNIMMIICGLGFCTLYIAEEYWYYEFEKSITSNEYEIFLSAQKSEARHWYSFWGPLLAQGVLPQILWVKRLREGFIAPFVIICVCLATDWLITYFSSINGYSSGYRHQFTFTDGRIILTFLWPVTVWWRTILKRSSRRV